MNDAGHVLDLIGLKCPLPALKTAKFLKSLPAGQQVTVRCSDPMAVIDIPALIQETGDTLATQAKDGDILTFTIVKR